VARSLTYRSAVTYEAAIFLLYGHRYFSRYRAISDLIPRGSSTLDLCCGPGALYSLFLRRKNVDYTGLDINEKFINRVLRMGAQAHVWDLRNDMPLPSADYVVMQGSLFHFLPDVTRIVDRMLLAAKHQVIVSEPIRNFASSPRPWLAAIGRHLTDPGTGACGSRFNERNLDVAFSRYAQCVRQSLVISGGREKLYVLDKKAAR
jgi:SAM-dependent methyltransferase